MTRALDIGTKKHCGSHVPVSYEGRDNELSLPPGVPGIERIKCKGPYTGSELLNIEVEWTNRSLEG